MTPVEKARRPARPRKSTDGEAPRPEGGDDVNQAVDGITTAAEAKAPARGPEISDEIPAAAGEAEAEAADAGGTPAEAEAADAGAPAEAEAADAAGTPAEAEAADASPPANPPPADPHAQAERDLVRHALGAVSALVPIGVFATDAGGRCWYVNQRLIDATDLNSQGVGDDSDLLEIPLDDLRGGLRSGQRGRGVGDPVVVRIRMPAVAGAEPSPEGPVTMHARVLPQIRADGTVAGYVGIVVNEDDSDDPQAVAFTSPMLMHASERLVDTLLDSSPDIITVLNADGSWRYSNAAAWRLLGYQEDFNPATGVFDLVHPEDVPFALTVLQRVQADELPPGESFELRVRGRDGDWRYLESTADNLTDDPIVRGIVIRSEDITAQRQARARLLEANERLSTLVGSLHLAALVEDTNRAIVLTNDAFLELFELAGPPGKLVGRTLVELGSELTRKFGDPTRAPEPDRVVAILRQRRRVIGDRIPMPDGRIIERDYIPIFVDHEYRGHVWLFRDVSGQARTEAEWTQLLAAQREENRRLVELDHVKASFLAEISHELRTPLTSILSFTELLRDGVGQDEPAEQVEFLDVITRNADRLLRLVDDLVLLDRAESGVLPVDWGPIDIPSLVETSVATFAPQAESKRISLETDLGEGLLLTGDSQRITQLIEVLLSNGVKFTPEGGRITVSATPSDLHWFISVADTGIGVPAAERESLFERFYRASNARAARIPGSGLGLSVARAIAQLHGGEISITASEAGGALVLVALPLGTRRTSEDEVHASE
ncbi:MAG TPA: PAS domain-containing sensor histidine kinase [Acidimicrobiales bacterium]|nr:PAS domain-containing sensor histidine kinase [Acidimicrobiales bacterium]